MKPSKKKEVLIMMILSILVAVFYLPLYVVAKLAKGFM